MKATASIATKPVTAIASFLEMDITKIEDLARLRKKRDEQLAKLNKEASALARIDEEIMALLPANLAAKLLAEPTSVSPANGSGGRRPRGAVQNAICDALRTGPATGLKISDIVSASNLTRPTVESWLFSRSGHKHAKKVSAGVYALKSRK